MVAVAFMPRLQSHIRYIVAERRLCDLWLNARCNGLQGDATIG